MSRKSNLLPSQYCSPPVFLHVFYWQAFSTHPRPCYLKTSGALCWKLLFSVPSSSHFSSMTFPLVLPNFMSSIKTPIWTLLTVTIARTIFKQDPPPPVTPFSTQMDPGASSQTSLLSLISKACSTCLKSQFIYQSVPSSFYSNQTETSALPCI